MVGIIEVKKDWRSSTQQEKDELERIAGIIATKLAIKWNEREETPKKYRGASIQIKLEESKPVAESLLIKLAKEEIVKRFGWNESEFNVEVSHLKGILNVVIDLKNKAQEPPWKLDKV